MRQLYQARIKCPNLEVFLPVHGIYKEYSKELYHLQRSLLCYDNIAMKSFIKLFVVFKLFSMIDNYKLKFYRTLIFFPRFFNFFMI